MKLRIYHPSRKRLLRWVQGEESELDDHIETCGRCSGLVEQLDVPGASIHDALLAALRPPDDLAPRLTRRIDERLRSRRELRLLGELMTLPFETSRILMAEPEEEDGR